MAHYVLHAVTVFFCKGPVHIKIPLIGYMSNKAVCVTSASLSSHDP